MVSFPVVIILGVLLVQNGLSARASLDDQTKVNADRPQLEWWQQSVVYQIYPRSFQDSNGDGVGDLNGITSRLDYFVNLGIDAIWISPFYESPMKDFGYDIADFKNVDPIFGTMDDFKKMASEFKKRGLKLIMDMVPNHSSDLHEWFVKSVQRIEPYTDYYVWRNSSGTDANGKPIPPNNWLSVFAGSAWEWNESRQQFYLHQFVKEQPDLNYENIKVRNEMLAIIKFWLDLGVDGFRVDAVPWMYEDSRELDEPEDPNRDPEARPDEYRYLNHIYTYNLRPTLNFLADMRQLLDIYSAADGRQRCMMVEANVADVNVTDYYGDHNKPVSHFPFNFHLLNVNPTLSAKGVLELVNVWSTLIEPEEHWPTILLGNHDQKRAATRWTEQGIDAANIINLLIKGTAISNQGEEIGMTDTYLTWEETVDPQACNTDPERYEFFSRDPARTPMHWNNGTGAGFSTNKKTWLPLNSNYPTVNVAAQESAEESHLKVFKELIKLRHTDVWKYGDYQSQTLNGDAVLAFTRSLPADGTSGGLLVLASFTDKTVVVDASSFNNVPTYGKVLIRSVGFQDQEAIVGSNVNTRSIQLGPRNSLVIQFAPV